MTGIRSLNEIIIKLRSLKPLLRKKYNVKEVMIFGSYIKGREKIGSDLDILISFTRKPSLLKLIELQYFLSEKLNIKVDLVVKDDLKPIIKENILKEAIMI
jgi:hypothetical protein